VSGFKDLVLDAELMKPLDRIAGTSLLKVRLIIVIARHCTDIDVNCIVFDIL